MDAAEMRERMRAGETLFGLGVRLSRSGEIAAVAKACGIDWLFVDMEHNPLSIDTAAQICLAAQAAGLPALVRIPGDDPLAAARLLDGGAAGIVVPHVDTAEQIRPVLDRCRFQPRGKRSIGGPLPQLGYAQLPAALHMAEADAQTLLVAMIESPKAVANAGAIAALDGVDALLIGTNDLALELGIAGELGHPRIEVAYRAVLEAASAAGKPVGLGGVYTADLLGRYLPLGFRFVLLGNDLAILLAGVRERLATARRIVAG
ncbi:MAG: aldolase/citrate lyase family protein [Geminicoccaceae bacterium]|nr:aldolase/citrate lyase family protein [Geminicoccaceae bacterium]